MYFHRQYIIHAAVPVPQQFQNALVRWLFILNKISLRILEKITLYAHILQL